MASHPEAVQVDTASGSLGTWFLGDSGALGLAREECAQSLAPLTPRAPSPTDQGEDGPCSGGGMRSNQSPVHTRHFWSRARPGCGPGRFPHLCSHLPPTWSRGRKQLGPVGQAHGGSLFLVALSGRAAAATAVQRCHAHSFTQRRWSVGPGSGLSARPAWASCSLGWKVEASWGSGEVPTSGPAFQVPVCVPAAATVPPPRRRPAQRAAGGGAPGPPGRPPGTGTSALLPLG